MSAVTLLGQSCSGHGGFPPRPNTSAASTVYANGIAIHRQGDSWATHCNSSPSCHASVLAAGSSTVYTENKQTCRIGDPVACGSVSAQGSDNVFAG